MTNENIENADSTNSEEEQVETVAIPKADYDKLNQTLGSLKRELKDLKKPKDEPKETIEKIKSEDSGLSNKLERMSLRQAGLTHADDIELARTLAKKWNVDIDEILYDEDFKIKLERQQTSRANALAGTNIKGGSSTSAAEKESPDYWLAKGIPPTKEQVPSRALRAKIARTFAQNSGNNKKFHND